MLVLSRRINERIVINGNIVVTILAIEGDKVKVGIDAPREVAVLREELWQAIQEQEKIAENLAKQQESSAFDELRKLLADQSDNEPPVDPPAKPD